MAQIIKHRRGSLEALSAVTSSLQKGELVIASGSSNLSVTNGASIVFAVPENGQVQAVNRILVGDSAPNTFAAGTYNGMLNGVPYYASGSSTLFLLGEGANQIPNLVGNIQPFSASVATSINALSASIGSGTIGQSVAALNTFSASTLVSLDTLNSFSASQLTKDSTLASYTGSVETRLTEVGVVSGSLIASASAAKTKNDVQDGRLDNLEATSASIETRLTQVGVVSGSLFSSASAAKTTNDSQDVSISNLNSFTQSFSQSVATDFSASNASINSLSASVASVTGNFSSSVATSFSASAASQAQLSASVAVTFSGVADAQSAQDDRLDAIEAVGLTYATTGSNVFFGTQTITGSLFITNNLIVQGSSSLQNVTASAVNIGTNQINLNTDFPAFRYAGLNVYDSGSSGVSASLQWDSYSDQWIFVHQESGSATVDSSILLYGPLSTDGLGTEATLTGNYLTKVENNGHGHHLTTSSIEDTGTKVTIHNSLDVTGTISGSIAGIGNVTAFSTSVDSRLDSIEGSIGSGGSLASRVDSLETSSANLNSFSSSTLGRLDNIESFSSSVETKLTEIGVVSGSLIASASAAKSTNDTQDGRLTNLEAKSASVDTSVAALNSSSASQQTQLDLLSSKTGSYATTGSNVFYGTQTISASFNVSGSTNFNGAVAVDNSNMNLTNSSSLNLTNGSSIYVNGNGVISGSIVGIGNVAAFSQSVDTRLDDLESAVGAGSNIDVRLDNLEATSASVNTSVAELNTFSASAKTQFTQIGVVSGSLFASASAAKTTNDTQDGRLDNLETTSASVNVSISNLNSKSASVDTSISNLNSFTSSFGTTFSSSVDSRLDALEGTGTIQGLGTENNVTFAKVTTTGDVVIGGDLVVQGNTVTLNTATLVVEDKLITLASGSTSSATADGAGIEIAGANANFVYQHSTTAFTSSVALIAPAVTASVNLGTSAGNTKRIAFRNTNGNLDLVPTASVAGDLLQWNGSDFVMSNVIDGGSF